MDSPICRYCGCSLVRLGIAREAATAFTYEGEGLLFCCQGCLDGFRTEPVRYLAETRELIVCPSCLGEKPRDLAVAVEHAGEPVYLCRCPHCLERFEKDPESLLAQLEI